MIPTTPTYRSFCVAVFHAIVAVSGMVISGTGAVGETPERDAVQQILDHVDLKGGLIVHWNCGDGKLTAALHARDNCVVQGLDTDSGAVARARDYIDHLQLDGSVSVQIFDGKRLPYADNLVNLIVADGLGDVTREEAMRVLAPGGTLSVKEDGRWTRTIKPRPETIDEWTHYLHDASGNAVAHDAMVAPPGRVQWIADPRHTRSHEHTPSINALVSANGRIFYIADEAPIVAIRKPPAWHLVARDAFNGLLLWQRPIASWFPHIVNWGVTPRQLQRKLVAVGNRVYVTFGLYSPVSAVDAVTGEVVRTYENTEGTEEITWHKGTLLLVARSVTEQRVAELAKWTRLAREDKSPLDKRETAEPLVNRWRAAESKAKKSILAIDADTGRLLWKKSGSDVAGLKTLSLCASGDRVFYYRRSEAVCVDLKTGHKHWATSAAPLHLVYNGVAVCVSSQDVSALSAETGKVLWKQPASLVEIRDCFIANGSLWLGGFKPCPGKRGPAWGPYFVTQRDLTTGQIKMQIEPENPGHHHRCYLNKATDRYILGSRRGVEFFDLASGEIRWNSWVRGVCKYGIMPCNGLLYAPPHACACYVAAKLEGFYALASEDKSPLDRPDSTTLERLEHGPAFGQTLDPRPSTLDSYSDWPTYRHDAGRSGYTPAPLPAVLRPKWQTDIGGRLTSPTVANGQVFIASVEKHRVVAIDAETGRSLWHVTAGARVDSPPTIHQGRAVFGSHDGSVYSVRASDGALAWRLQTAREQRQIVDRGQLESASPALGSVLVRDGVAYVTAGRSSYLDGGIDLCRIDLATGRTLSTTSIYSPDPQTGKQPEQYGPSAMPGALADILSSDSHHVYLRDIVFDTNGNRQPEGPSHLLTMTGYLDDSWAHRSYWVFGTRCSIACGCSGRDKNLIYGRLLVFNESTIYGYGRKTVDWSNQLQDGPYRVYALKKGATTALWEKPVTIQVRAVVLAGSVLFVAGPPADSIFGPTPSNDNEPAVLLALSATNGTELARQPLDSAPVFDGMAAARGRLFIALENGRVVCMGKKQP